VKRFERVFGRILMSICDFLCHMIESLISDTQSLQNKLKAYWSARPIEALASMREGGIVYLHLYHKRENCQCWNTRLVWPSLKRLKQVLITRLLRPFNLPTYTTNNYDILDTFDTLIPLQWSCETDRHRHNNFYCHPCY
jgi:hypothetical protein